MRANFTRTLLASLGLACSLYANAEPASDQQQWYYLSSSATDQIYRFEEDTGEFLGILNATVPGPFASFIGPEGDLFVASQKSGSIVRFDSQTGEYEGEFVESGSGGLSRPTAPLMTFDGKYIIVGDLDLNGYYRYDGATGDFIDIFAQNGPDPIDGAFMPIFSPYPEHAGKILFASGFTNSIQIYDVETGNYEGDLVKPGAGGLLVPIGLSYGPDGNIYTSSSGDSSVKRYNGRTGEYIDDFVPSGSGGLKNPRAIEFGGTNSDLYVVSNDTNNVLVYDRITGEFLGEHSNGNVYGYLEPRGLMFTARPNFFVEAKPAVVDSERRYARVKVKILAKDDWIDNNPDIELVEITVNDPERDPYKDVLGERLGKKDLKFWIRTRNDSDADLVYTFTYRATNKRGGTMLAMATVTVPPSDDDDE